MLGGWGRDRNNNNIIRRKRLSKPPLPIKTPRKMTSKGLVLKETELVGLSGRPLSGVRWDLPGISCGHVQMCLFPVMISHSLPLRFLLPPPPSTRCQTRPVFQESRALCISVCTVSGKEAFMPHE